MQSILLISERKWCDFISYSNGMLMMVKRVEADLAVQDAIINAAIAFHEKLDEVLELYASRIAAPDARLIPTERIEPIGDMEL